MALTFRSTRRSIAMTSLLVWGLLCVGLVVATSAEAETSFTFRSRGFGHGLGMSQYGAKGFAEAGFGYEHILRYYYGSAGTDPKTTVPTLPSEPTCYVNVDRDASASNAGYTKAVWTLRPGYAGGSLKLEAGGVTRTIADGLTTFTANGSNIVVRDPSGATATYTGTVSVSGVGGNPALVQVIEGTGAYSHTNVRFRGTMLLHSSSGKIKLINRLSMRDYLYGVVPRESPASWPAEQLKAQAVAARSYALTSTRTELYTDTRDQVYGGHSRIANGVVTAHEHASTNSAVDATARQVVAYDGKTVRAYFFSTSGGHTENSENVWVSALPYIRGVPDPYELVSGAAYHTWEQYTHDAATVRSRLVSAGISSSSLPAIISDIRVSKRGVSGRVLEVVIRGADGSSRTFSGSNDMDRFRRAVGSRPSTGYAVSDRWWCVNPKTYRIAGTDRYHTSVQASLQAFPPGSSKTAATAVIVGGLAPADALAASGLAGAAGGGPVLLTPPSSLDSRVRTEIARLGVSTVYIVGGEGVVGTQVETALLGIPSVTRVVRLAGLDRYETAAAVFGEIARVSGQPGRAIVVNGESIVDGVVVSGLAYARDLPVVLVNPTSVPAASASALSGVSTSLVVGGSGVVSDAVMSQLPGATRIAAGNTRYHTAALLGDYVVTHEGFRWNRCYVASGTSLVDALSIGPTSGESMHPVLLAENYSFDLATQDRLLTKKSVLGAVWMVGGEGALSGWVQTRVEATLE
jgi:stage II sporulation protein D